MIVIYAEKPDMGKKIASALGGKSVSKKDGYISIKIDGEDAAVTWGFGHMYGLKDAKDYHEDYAKWDVDIFPIFPKKYEVKMKDKVEKQVKVISTLFKKADTIVNATDADREGELIFSYVYHSTMPKTSTVKVKRMWMQTTTPVGLRDAYKNAKDISEYATVESAAKVRAAIDWLAGINLTVFVTKRFPGYSNGPVSIGRVQTPTVALIVNREIEIRNFKSHPFWDIVATFKSKNGEYQGNYIEEKMVDKDKAQNIFNKVNGQKGKITNITTKSEKRQVPLLYDLTSLQMDANSKLGFTAQKTLNVAQKLYEEQYTTYPRTTSCYLPEDMKKQIVSVLDRLKSSSVYSKYLNGITYQPFTNRHFDDNKVESHFAIVPTGKSPDDLSGDELKIYDLIAKSVIRIAYPDAEILITNVTTNVNGYDFKSKGEVIKNNGWYVVDAMPSSKITLPSSKITLPALSVNEIVAGEYNVKEGKTQPPKRYTEKSLIAAMKNAGAELKDEEAVKLMKDSGIGTPATRAGIIETIIARDYVKREKRNFAPTEKGIQLIEFLPINTLKSAEMTGEMEKRLLDIEKGKESPVKVLRDFEKSVSEWCEILKAMPVPTAEIKAMHRESIGICPVCGENVNDYKTFCKCSNKECGFSLSKEICEKKLTDKNIKDLLSGKSISVSKLISKKTGKEFSACLKLDENGKITFSFDNVPKTVKKSQPKKKTSKK